MKEFNLDWQKGYEEGLRVGIANENQRIMSTQKIEPYTITLTDPEQIKMWEENAEAIRKIHETIDKQLKLIKGEQK